MYRKKIFIRIPLIPTINDSKEEIEAIYDIIKRLNNVEEIRVIPYHTFGKEKYTTLGLPQPEIFPLPDDETVNDIQKFLTKK